VGGLAAFARWSGDRWFVGVLNGPNARSLELGLGFLGKGKYRVTLARDKGRAGAGGAGRDDTLTPSLGRRRLRSAFLAPGAGHGWHGCKALTLSTLVPIVRTSVHRA
jgi:alpha-glucosidase